MTIEYRIEMRNSGKLKIWNPYVNGKTQTANWYREQLQKQQQQQRGDPRPGQSAPRPPSQPSGGRGSGDRGS